MNQTRKTCLGEIFDSNNGALLQHQACIELRLGMYRASIGHVSHCERPCFATRLGMFRNSIRYVSQRREWPPKRQANRCYNKTLIDRQLQKTRQEARICAQHFSRSKETCSFQYRLFRFLSHNYAFFKSLPPLPQLSASPSSNPNGSLGRNRGDYWEVIVSFQLLSAFLSASCFRSRFAIARYAFGCACRTLCEGGIPIFGYCNIGENGVILRVETQSF